jgi:phytanoyl-CoA hydroxylase
VSADRIDRLLALYARDLATSKQRFFRQSTDRYERNAHTSHGYVRQSFLDIHDYANYPEFSAAARNIYCSKELLQALTDVTGCARHNLMQTMFFDLNTATWPHQDWYYLDSVPNGQLTAVWIALEDIEEKAGRFYVMPDSHRVEFGAKAPGVTLDMWVERVRKYVEQNRKSVYAPGLKKGDVLFWNSRTVHGSLPTQDATYSRKSLTAHYLPSHLEFGNIFATRRNLNYKDFGGVQCYRNQPDYSIASHARALVKSKVYNYPLVREALRKLRG